MDCRVVAFALFTVVQRVLLELWVGGIMLKCRFWSNVC
jgi:hypothetical protein